MRKQNTPKVRKTYKYYKREFEEQFLRLSEEELEYYRNVKKSYSIGYLNENRLSQLTAKQKREYYKRELDIISPDHRYENERAKLYIKNYTKSLRMGGVSEYWIRRFRKAIRNEDVSKLIHSGLLPSINLWYPKGKSHGNDKQILDTTDEQQILKELIYDLESRRKHGH